METQSDRFMKAIKNNRFAAIVIFLATFFIGLASFTTALSTITNQISSLLGFEHRGLYRSLVADLDNLDQAVHFLGNSTDKVFYPAGLEYVIKAADPVCKSRQKVSEIGDTQTRSELDTICKFVDGMQTLSEHTDGVGGVALAKVLDDQQSIRHLYDRLKPRS